MLEGRGLESGAGVPRSTSVAPGGSGLLDAVLLLTSDLDVRGALDRLVQASCALTGARYGVLALVDADGVMADFVIHGMSEEAIAKIPSLPTGHGLLGLLLEDSAQPMRVDRISAHPQALGFPAHHPPMDSFLGVPVRVDGAVFGNLYLGEKTGGATFNEADEVLLGEFAQIAGLVVGNALTHATTSARQRWLEASLAMSHALERAADPVAALGEVVEHLQRVTGAIGVAAVREDHGELDVVAALRADGATPELGELRDRWGRAIALAVEQETVVEAAPRGDHLVRLVIPMSARLLRGHYLLVALNQVEVGLSGPDIELYEAFAAQAALVLDRAQALAERHEHLLVADRDRIARDLHDTVIQRLFAIGLQVQGLRGHDGPAELTDRLDGVADDLNATIRDIRSTIFELRRPSTVPVSQVVRGLLEEYVPVLGFTPYLRLRGPLDDDVLGPTVREHLVATLREALSNVARHAEADACVVEIVTVADRLELRVSDNGRGIPAEVSESGLRNIRRRAFDLGGTVRILPEEPAGTAVEWQVPLPG